MIRKHKQNERNNNNSNSNRRPALQIAFIVSVVLCKACTKNM